MSDSIVPRSTVSTDRRLALALVFVALLLVVAGVLVVPAMTDLDNRRNAADRAHQAIVSLHRLEATLAQLEADRSGYLLDGARSSLDAWEAGGARVNRELAGLATIISDEPAQQRRLDALRTAVNARIAQSLAAIELRRERGQAAAATLGAAEQDGSQASRIRNTLREMFGEEQRRLDARGQAFGRALRWHGVAIVSLAVLTAGLLGWVWVLARRAIASRALANGELEAAVASRTRDLEQAGEAMRAEIARRREAEDALRSSQGELRHAVDQLASQEARLRAIIESASDAILTVDGEQRIVLANPATGRIFHCAADSLVGTPLDHLIPERFRERHRAHVRKFGETGVTQRRMGGDILLFGLRSDGEEFPIDASIAHFDESDQPYYTVILRDASERREAEDALKRSREEFRDLSAQLVTVREEERKRIARELHDDLQQTLAAIRMDLVALRGRMSTAHESLIEQVDRMDGLLLSTVASVRRIAADLRPTVLDEMGLRAALEALAADFSGRYQIECSLEEDEDFPGLDDARSTALYRMAQEALNNVLKHAAASVVRIRLAQGDGRVVVTIADNGRGASELDLRKARSFGILGMRERAAQLGGKVEVTGRPGGGTAVEISLPLDEDMRASQ